MRLDALALMQVGFRSPKPSFMASISTRPASRPEALSSMLALYVSLRRLSPASSTPHALSDSPPVPGLKQELLVEGYAAVHVCVEHCYVGIGIAGAVVGSFLLEVGDSSSRLPAMPVIHTEGLDHNRGGEGSPQIGHSCVQRGLIITPHRSMVRLGIPRSGSVPKRTLSRRSLISPMPYAVRKCSWSCGAGCHPVTNEPVSRARICSRSCGLGRHPVDNEPVSRAKVCSRSCGCRE